MKPLFSLLFFALCCCSSSPQPQPAQIDLALGLVRGIGDGVLRLKGAAELARSAPELMAVIDTDPSTPGVLTAAEVEGFIRSSLTSPEQLALLITTLVIIRES